MKVETAFWDDPDVQRLAAEQQAEVRDRYDGKGEPGQSNAVSHGCPPARFRNVNVLNTASGANNTPLEDHE